MGFSFGMQSHPWYSKRIDDYAFAAAELGFGWLEVTFEYFTSPSFLKAGHAERLKKISESAGIKLTGHMPYLLSSVNFNPEIAAVMRRIFLKAIDFSGRAGIETLTLHPPYGSGVDSELVLKWLHAAEKREFKAIGRHAERAGVKIAIENLTDSADDIERYMDSFGFSFTFDIGHWNISGKEEHYSAFLRKFKSKVKNIHIHDNNGKEDEHLPVGSGRIGWRGFFSMLKRLKYAGPIIIENKDMEDIVSSVGYLKHIKVWK